MLLLIMLLLLLMSLLLLPRMMRMLWLLLRMMVMLLLRTRGEQWLSAAPRLAGRGEERARHEESCSCLGRACGHCYHAPPQRHNNNSSSTAAGEAELATVTVPLLPMSDSALSGLPPREMEAAMLPGLDISSSERRSS
ncbi:unnamed protein product [Lampetra planeri]